MIGVHALLLYALVAGLGAPLAEPPRERLTRLDLIEDPSPPPAEPPQAPTARTERARPREKEGAAAPANLRATPSEIVLPAPEIPLPLPPRLVAAPVAATGSAPEAGAAERPGPGTGSGGVGSGLGSGERGNGTGGGGSGLASPVRWLSGEIRPSDHPRRSDGSAIAGTVGLRFVVGPDGRVRDCAVTRTSGSRELDATTCRLIRKRFRYRPARNEAGEPIAAAIFGEHVWEVGAEPPPVEVEADQPA